MHWYTWLGYEINPCRFMLMWPWNIARLINFISAAAANGKECPAWIRISQQRSLTTAYAIHFMGSQVTNRKPRKQVQTVQTTSTNQTPGPHSLTTVQRPLICDCMGISVSSIYCCCWTIPNSETHLMRNIQFDASSFYVTTTRQIRMYLFRSICHVTYFSHRVGRCVLNKK